MEKTKPIFHSIALITLIAIFLLFWHFFSKEADAVKPSSETMPTLFSHLSVMLSVSLLAIPLALGSAFYIEEWLAETNWIRRFIESKVAILEAIPSLLYGLLVVLLFIFQSDNTLLVLGTLTFLLIVLPVVMQTTQRALRSIPTPMREAAYALGANRGRVLAEQVVRPALPAILGGVCRGMSSAFATAALLIGIHAWGYTTDITVSRDTLTKFLLFLAGALLLSVPFSLRNQR